MIASTSAASRPIFKIRMHRLAIRRGEIFNSVTHLFGSIQATAGLVTLRPLKGLIEHAKRETEMNRILAVLAVALVALPVFAEEPTPTPGVNRQKSDKVHTVLSQQGRAVKPTVRPTTEPVGAIKFGRDTLASREAKTPSPSVEGRPSKDEKQEQVKPTASPAASINLNSSRANSRGVQPTMTPTPSVKRGKPQ